MHEALGMAGRICELLKASDAQDRGADYRILVTDTAGNCAEVLWDSEVGWLWEEGFSTDKLLLRTRMPHAGMSNKSMQKKLIDGECLDVRKIGEPIDGSGIWPDDPPREFKLKGYIDECDYADALTERWIWSIGKRKSDGEIRAATDNRFYQNEDWECLWLR